MYVSGKYLFCRPTAVQKWTMFLHIFLAYTAGESMSWHGSKKTACPKQAVNHKSAWKKEAYFTPKNPYSTQQYARKRHVSTTLCKSMSKWKWKWTVLNQLQATTFLQPCQSACLSISLLVSESVCIYICQSVSEWNNEWHHEWTSKWVSESWLSNQ